VLSEAECQEFLAACPLAGRILRPLLRMLDTDPLPGIILRTPYGAPAAPLAPPLVLISPIVQILDS
jgi:hypothetical protein